jgi:hypothetical protein
MGDHADDTMNYDDEPGDHITGDGGPQDIAIMEFITGFRAPPHEVSAGMAFQAAVLDFLRSCPVSRSEHEYPWSCWVETRGLILRDHFHSRSEAQLSQQEFSRLNYLESVRGDLTDMYQGVSVECQTGVTGPHVSWEHSKYERSKAAWQCFGFTSGTRLMVPTSSIRTYLDLWKVEPSPSKRPDGGPYFSFGERFLRGIDGMDLLEWRTWYPNTWKRTEYFRDT